MPSDNEIPAVAGAPGWAGCAVLRACPHSRCTRRMHHEAPSQTTRGEGRGGEGRGGEGRGGEGRGGRGEGRGAIRSRLCLLKIDSTLSLRKVIMCDSITSLAGRETVRNVIAYCQSFKKIKQTSLWSKEDTQLSSTVLKECLLH